ncbi:MAG: hypothetical protein A3G18_07025 [Rhodospirillales bacterium RIFCSPLOWO2_12_FULL_58_28]|nr:MAG: hypothetical protein A3H92_01660 [Rhodospirillales bacterium RIFCSPLOWO2_02_FULL_58_16]OHC78219.1 MAG: hypothetical protein A3G18_07025 [Rhodospirillales bacterium RIFCSPLOWO2_12_FULL_58_28]
MGWANVGFRPLGQGAFVLETQSRFHVPVTVGTRILFDEPILALRLPSSGCARIRHPGNPTLEESAGTYNISLVADPACLIDHQPGTHDTLTAVYTVGRLRTMLDGQRTSGPIRRFLDGHSDNFGAAGRASATLHRIAAQIRTHPYEGVMASLYVQGKACELMAEVLTDLAGEEKLATRTLSADRRRALAARDILMANLAAPPSISDLARQVELSQRRLNEVFHDLFGAGVFVCLTQWRLDHACDLLARGDLLVKQVAHRMGYAHLSNFTHAFTRRFGTPPTKWRSKNGSGRHFGESP